MATLTPLRLFLLIITNVGGEGKTHLTLLLRALFDLLGEVELTLDADPGNKAASSTGSPSIKFLDPFFDAEEAIAKVKGVMTSSTSLLIDAGANMQAASRQFEDTCRGPRGASDRRRLHRARPVGGIHQQARGCWQSRPRYAADRSTVGRDSRLQRSRWVRICACWYRT